MQTSIRAFEVEMLEAEWDRFEEIAAGADMLDRRLVGGIIRYVLHHPEQIERALGVGLEMTRCAEGMRDAYERWKRR